MSVTISGDGTITGLSAGGLPDGTVTAADLASTLDLTGKTVTLPAGVGGKVLQVVSTTKTDTFSASTTSGSSHDVTGLTVSITPSSTNSKVMVFASVSIAQNNADTNQGGFCILTKGGSALSGAIADSASNRIRTTSSGTQINRYTMSSIPVLYLDSPNSTSSLTYGIAVGNFLGSAGTVFVNRVGDDLDNSNIARAISTITVMEIAA